MNDIILFETERLTMIIASPHHAQFLCDLYHTPEINKFYSVYGWHTPEDALNKMINHHGLPHYQKHGFSMCIIREKSSKKLIGICGMVKRDFLDAPNLGYALLPEYWGKGYIHESCLGLVEICRKFGFKKLYSNCDPSNVRSEKVALRLGMVMKSDSFPWGSDDDLRYLYGMDL